MALAAEYWATVTGVDPWDGLSLASAAVIDPNDANDIWTIINAEVAPTVDVVINLCADATVPINAGVAISRDATSTFRIALQGRDAADTVDQEVTLDAQGGAYSIITLTASDYWFFKDIHATNNDRISPNYGWSMGSGAGWSAFLRCTGSWAYRGIHQTGGQQNSFDSCYAHNNKHYGIFSSRNTGSIVNCVSHNNGDAGIYSNKAITRCITYDNGVIGIRGFHITQCISVRDVRAFYGYSSTGTNNWHNCIAVDSANYAYFVEAGNQAMTLRRCADYNNTSGRSSGGTLLMDEDDPGLSADPFIEGAPKLVLFSGGSGATASNNGSDSDIEDLSGSGWGGNVAVGDRIRFFENSTQHEDALETVVTAISVGSDNVITVSPQVTAGTNKQCWLGGGNFALNNDANGGVLCKNLLGTSSLDGGWSTSYLDIGAVQRKDRVVLIS